MAEGIVEQDLAIDNRPGLIRSADVRVNGSDTEGDTRWISGFSFDPDPCGTGYILDACQLGASAATATTSTCIQVGPIQPFVIEASEKHSTFGTNAQARQERVRRKLLCVQSKTLEAELWNGTKAIARSWTNNQYLKNATGLTTLGTAPVGGVFGYVDGLAALEQAISDGSACGRGAIHASPQLVTHWVHAQLVRSVPNPPTGTLMTELGTVVIPGAGYDGSGPQGAINPNRLEWAYATSIPIVRLGEIHYSGTDDDSVAVDWETNDRTVRASRFAAVTISPCFRAAALMTMTTALQVPGS